MTLTSPSNGATGQAATPTLSWNASSGATAYNVYLGTSNPPGLWANNVGTTSYTPGTALSAGSIYYWSIVATNSTGSAPNSAIWSFTTANSSSPSPSGYWSFDNGTINDTQVLDSSGNGNTGTLSNAAPVSGKVNQAFSFSGSGSYVSVPDMSAFELAHNLSLAAWIKVSNTGGNSQPENFICKYNDTDIEYGYLLQVKPDGTINLRLGGNNISSGSRDGNEPTAVADGNWHHLAVVITLGQSIAWYIDGQLVSTDTSRTVISWGNNSTLFLGANPSEYYGMPFTGALDEVRIYNQAIGASDVAALYAAGSGGSAPPQVTRASPANEATGQPTTPTLSWNASSGATSYSVYLGTSSPPGLWASNVTTTSYTPGTALSAGAIYYWYIVAANSAGTSPNSAIWNFTTSSASGTPTAGNSTVTASTTSVPADGATTATITVTLKNISGNPVSGKTVTLAQGGGHSSILPASGVSNSSGVVVFTVKDGTAETVMYTATTQPTP